MLFKIFVGLLVVAVTPIIIAAWLVAAPILLLWALGDAVCNAPFGGQ